MIPFQSELKLYTQRNLILQKIGDAQSKIKSLQTDIDKQKKELNIQNQALENVDGQIKNTKELYKQAFSYVLKERYKGDINEFFRNYSDQETLIQDFTEQKTCSALSVFLLHYHKQCDSWDTLIILRNVALVRKDLYRSIVRFVHITSTSSKPCIVHLYPIHLIYSHILFCFDKLSDTEVYDPFKGYLKNKEEIHSPIHYIKLYKRWVHILIHYWGLDMSEIPPVPDSIKPEVRDLLTFDTSIIYDNFKKQNQSLNAQGLREQND